MNCFQQDKGKLKFNLKGNSFTDADTMESANYIDWIRGRSLAGVKAGHPISDRAA